MSDTPITHQPERQRFELHTQGQTAYLEYRPLGSGALAFTHTIVPRALEGQGIGSRLVKHALDWAASQQLKVRPDCSFVGAWVKRHPDYQAHLHA